MGGKSDFAAEQTLDAIYGLSALGAPATFHLALYTVLPDDTAGSGTEVSTSVWTNYAREAITNNATNFPAASGTAPTSKSNGTVIDFGTASITGTAPELVGWALKDAASGGNTWHWGEFVDENGDPDPITVANSDSFTIPVGDLIIEED